MVYGAIDEKNRQSYTHLKEIFAAIHHKQTEYNWLITDSDIIARSEALNALNTGVIWQYENEKQTVIHVGEYCFLSGEELTNIVLQDDSQWIWGVLSGFDKSIPLEEILKYPFPKADGYAGFWKNPLSIQHPLASVEIVPWDSALVLVLSKNREIVDSFRMAFPKSQDLSEVNAQFADGTE